MDALRNLLLAASSQDPTGLANAENQLKTLEIQPGFHAALLVSLEKKNQTRNFLPNEKFEFFRVQQQIKVSIQVLVYKPFCT